MDKGNPTREVCQMCHEVSRVGFWVPNEMWLKASRKGFEDAIVCLSCFTRIADEKLLDWDSEIKFYPVSAVTHQGLLTKNKYER